MPSTGSQDFELLMIEKSDDMKTHQWVYLLLRNNLMCGRIGPGIPLTIRGLAQMLQVSPMPIREALHRLACEGAVEVKNNRRVIVPSMTAEKFKELSELRILLETHAAEIIQTEKDEWYISNTGWDKKGLFLAKLKWN